MGQILILSAALVLYPQSPSIAGNNGFAGGFVGGIVGGIVGGAMQQQKIQQQQYLQQQQQYYQQQQQQYYQQQQQYYRQQQYQQQQQQQQQYYRQQQDEAREEERRRSLAKKKAQEKAKQQQQDQAKLTPPSANDTSSVPIAVTMKRQNGTLWVPAQINKAVAIDFVVDSGAAEVTIPKDVFKTLIRTGTLSEKDIIGKGKFGTADGSEVEGIRFKLATLQVGDKILTDVTASVIPSSSDASQPLLGQTFLSRFQSWSIDNNSGTLNLPPQGSTPPSDSQQTREAATGTPPPAASPQPQPQPVSVTSAVASTAPSPASPATAAKQQAVVNDPATVTNNTPVKQETVPSASALAIKGAVAAPSFPPNTAYTDARRSLWRSAMNLPRCPTPKNVTGTWTRPVFPSAKPAPPATRRSASSSGNVANG